MKFIVEWSERAKKQLKKLNRSVAELIVRWVYKNLDGCENPYLHGKALSANRSGQWRYRIGDYRLICDIDNNKLTIYVIELGHRKNVYTE